MDYHEKNQKSILRSSQKNQILQKKNRTSIDRAYIEFEMENQF